MNHLNVFLELLVVLELLLKCLAEIIGLITLLNERRNDVVLRCCCSYLTVSGAPRVISPGKCSHRRGTDAVPAHVHLLGLGERLAVGAVADYVVAREALGLV